MTRREAAAIVTELIDNLTDRKGFDAVWDEMDTGDQYEMREAWISIVLDESV